jgi:hypothetical protein
MRMKSQEINKIYKPSKKNQKNENQIGEMKNSMTLKLKKKIKLT